MRTIVILGGTSHIAKGLISCFLERPELRIEWFGRSAERMELFLKSERLSGGITLHEGYDELFATPADLLVNCVGAGTPGELAGDCNRWFSVLQKFDDLALDYLQRVNDSALYVMFSSGAVYGRRHGEPVRPEDAWSLCPNAVSPQDYYGICKLYSEAKHRSLPRLRIADLRIFSYFSRFAPLDAGYFMTDLVSALVRGEVFVTQHGDIVRDYPHPADLASLVLRCAAEKEINTAFDVASACGVSKFEILRTFEERFSLKWRFGDGGPESPNGRANVYLPAGSTAEKLLDWKAQYTSLATLAGETQAILKGR